MIWKKKQLEDQKNKLGDEDGTDDGDNPNNNNSTCYVRFDTRNEATNHIAIHEQHLRDQFYSHGEIVSVKMHQPPAATATATTATATAAALGAFIEYTTHDAAELAILTMNQKIVHGRKIMVNWARQPKRGQHNNSSNNNHQHGPIQPKAPPGQTFASKQSSSSSLLSSSSPSPRMTSTATTTTTTNCLPVGFAPSAQVAAAVKARAMGRQSNNDSSRNNDLPKPMSGGGPIRRIGLRTTAPAHKKPYYPSSDPNRLGTNITATTNNNTTATQN